MKILFIGRFQPFHLGHLDAFNIIRSLSKDIVMALGSPREESFFSLDERIEMIKQNTSIAPKVVEDLEVGHPQYGCWGRYVLDIVGDVDIVATGEPRVLRDFRREGKHVLFLNRDTKKISGTIIRKSIESRTHSWKHLVSEESLRVIEHSKYYRSLSYEGR